MGLAILAALVSAGLGYALSGFRVLILLPAFLIIGALMLGAGLANSESIAWDALALITVAVGLQSGYLVGIARSVISRIPTKTNVNLRSHELAAPFKRSASGPC